MQREEELAMIEQQINPALDNNAHVSNYLDTVYDDVIWCHQITGGIILSAGDGGQPNEECS